MDGAVPSPVEHVRQLVVDGVDVGDPVRRRARVVRRRAQGLLVAVDADERARRAAGEQRLGVAAHAQGGIDDGPRRGCSAGASRSTTRSRSTGTCRWAALPGAFIGTVPFASVSG